MDTPTTQDTHTATARTCITQRTAAPAGGEGQQHARGRARDPAPHALHYSRAWMEKQRPRAHDTASHPPTSHRSARHTSMRARASHVSRASVMPHESESPEYHTYGSVRARRGAAALANAAGPHAAFGVDAPCRRTRIGPSAHAHTAVDTQPRVLPSVLRSPRAPVRPSRPLRGPNAARTGLAAPFGVDPTARRAARTLRAYPRPSVDSQRHRIPPVLRITPITCCTASRPKRNHFCSPRVMLFCAS